MAAITADLARLDAAELDELSIRLIKAAARQLIAAEGMEVTRRQANALTAAALESLGMVHDVMAAVLARLAAAPEPPF